MIAYLSGRVLKTSEDQAVIDVHGIGFKVFFAKNDLAQLGLNNEVQIYVSTVFKREGVDLYGFLSQDGLLLFETLTKISGVGPKASIKIVSLGSLDKLKKAIDEGDIKFFAQIKGVGTKTIQKMILELSGKLSKQKIGKDALSAEDNKILEALTNLGFEKSLAISAIASLPSDLTKIQDKIKFCLKKLASN